MYAVVFMDAIHFHARNEGRIVKRAVYIAIGIDMEGRKDVLGMYVGQNESAKFWLSILNGLKNRGVKDQDEERAYPVRIDPGQYVPANEFLLCMVTQGAPTQHSHWDGPAYAGYIDNNLKNARLYIAFNETDCPTLMSFFRQAGAQVTSASLDLTTMTDNSKGETVFQLGSRWVGR